MPKRGVAFANEEEGREGGRIVDVWEVLMGMELVVSLVVELEVVLWRICWWEGWGWVAGVWVAGVWVSVFGKGDEIVAIALF